MKDKETTNLLFIMVVSIVLLVILYLPQKKQTSSPKNFTNTKKEVQENTKLQKLNSPLVYKMTKY